MVSPIPSRRPCITFLTDFGMRDTYVAQMKGVALGINPDAHLVDLTHEIPPQQVLRAAYVWNDAISAFPASTIHVGVVDPGVGSHRRLVAAEIGDQKFVCPDNGLLTLILANASIGRVVTLNNPQWWRDGVSNTFHGRDILTPIAAAWSLGHDLSELGTPDETPLVTLPLAGATRSATSALGRIIDIDRFGNLITNIGLDDLPVASTSIRIEVGSFRISGLARCYADQPVGEVLGLIGSTGRLEIAVRDGNASEELQADCGHPVVVRWLTP